MGAWGSGGFENDEALDFAGTVRSSDDIARTFATVPDDPMASIDAGEAQRIIAAAECIAALMGRPADDLPKALAKRLKKFGNPPVDLVGIARESVSRVLRNSELLDLWAEGDPRPFNRALTSLIDRLNPAIKAKKRRRSRKAAPVQICSFCDRPIELDELFSFSVSQVVDMDEFGSAIRLGDWCHLACLNEHLHPKHIVQNWRFDPEEMETEARKLLDLD